MFRSFLTVVSLVVVADCARSEPPAAKLPATFDPASVDAYVEQRVREKGLVGLSLAVVCDGRIVLTKGYGHVAINGARVEPETAFAIGSVTKQFACACIFLLAEDGKLSVRDPVAKYYPGLTRAREVTLYDLMSHASGYPDYYPLDFLDRRMHKPIAGDDLIRQYAGGKLDFAPGSRWSYSNTGYTILGRVVEKVSGESFGQFLDRRILKPAGMEQSLFEPDPNRTGLARGHSSFALGPPEPIVPEAAGWANAAGALYASASDLARWDIALMEGRILNRESMRLMTAPRALADGKEADYGCGLAISRQSGETVLSHGGAVSGFLASNTFVPRTKTAVVALANSEHADPRPLAREILGLLLKDESKRAEAIPVVNGPPAKDAATALFRQMQAGAIDRAQLGEEFSIWLTDERVRSAAPRLKALGEPKSVEVTNTGERGGMETSRLRFTFASTVVEANMFRSTDGKIQQFLLTRG